jgi:superoxide reductase
MKIFICGVCGHLEFGEAPANCPVCYAPKDKFKQNDNVFKESAEKSKEAAVKHIPVVKIAKMCGLIPEGCGDAHIRIGEVLHPMEEKHFIKFIDVYLDGKWVERLLLSPNGINPAGSVHFKHLEGKVTVVELCNVHGYWMTEVTA